LNALRDEHFDNQRRQTMEKERQRQLQLAIKLNDLRQKKQVKTTNKFEFNHVEKCTSGIFGVSKTNSSTTLGWTRSRDESTIRTTEILYATTATTTESSRLYSIDRIFLIKMRRFQMTFAPVAPVNYYPSVIHQYPVTRMLKISLSITNNRCFVCVFFRICKFTKYSINLDSIWTNIDLIWLISFYFFLLLINKNLSNLLFFLLVSFYVNQTVQKSVLEF